MVIFVGANEGFPLKTPQGPSADCCTPDWAAAYANRVRTMMQTYLTSKDVRVYWLLVMAPRDPERQKIARAVNAAVRVAGANYGSQIRVLDMPAIFTPDGKYQDAIRAYNQGIAVNANFAPNYMGRALANLGIDPSTVVIDDLDKAIELDPDYVDAYLERAAYLLSEGEVDAARADLMAAEALFPGAPRIYMLNAQAFILEGNYTEALKMAKLAYETDRTLLPALSLIHISEPTRLLSTSYAVFCLQQKNNK